MVQCWVQWTSIYRLFAAGVTGPHFSQKSLRPLALKSKFIRQFQFSDNIEDLYGKCCWIARPFSPATFSIKIFLFFNNSDCHKFSFFNGGGLKLGYFGIFDALFLFLAFFKLSPIIRNFSRKNVVT